MSTQRSPPVAPPASAMAPRPRSGGARHHRARGERPVARIRGSPARAARSRASRRRLGASRARLLRALSPRGATFVVESRWRERRGLSRRPPLRAAGYERGTAPADSRSRTPRRGHAARRDRARASRANRSGALRRRRTCSSRRLARRPPVARCAGSCGLRPRAASWVPAVAAGSSSSVSSSSCRIARVRASRAGHRARARPRRHWPKLRLREASRQLHDRRWHVGLRRESRKKLLDLTLRLAGRHGRQLLDVRLGQVRTQENERRQMERPLLDPSEQRREAPYETRGIDPTERGALAHAEPPNAEVHEGRARRSQVEAPRFDLDEVDDQPRGDLVPFEADRGKTRDELVIGQVSEMHDALIPSRNSRLLVARCMCFARRTARERSAMRNALSGDRERSSGPLREDSPRGRGAQRETRQQRNARLPRSTGRQRQLMSLPRDRDRGSGPRTPRAACSTALMGDIHSPSCSMDRAHVDAVSPAHVDVLIVDLELLDVVGERLGLSCSVSKPVEPVRASIDGTPSEYVAASNATTAKPARRRKSGETCGLVSFEHHDLALGGEEVDAFALDAEEDERLVRLREQMTFPLTTIVGHGVEGSGEPDLRLGRPSNVSQKALRSLVDGEPMAMFTSVARTRPLRAPDGATTIALFPSPGTVSNATTSPPR